MFNFSQFSVRSPERDRETDDRRLSRLQQLFAELSNEIERERAGLKARYDSSVSDAGFAQWALENDPTSRNLSSRVATLNDTVMRCLNRLELLERQLVLLRELDAHSTGYRSGESPAQGALSDSAAVADLGTATSARARR